MSPVEGLLERRLAALDTPLALVLPGGRRLGAPPPNARVTLTLRDAVPLVHLASGAVGQVAQDLVEGRLELQGSMREVMRAAAQMIGADPTRTAAEPVPLTWWRRLLRRQRSQRRHAVRRDEQQIQFHYDVSDDFYALWLDPRRVYSCAYFREPSMSLAQAQEAKLDHICRKLRLQKGERFLDVGAGWGALLVWAAEHYGVRAHGITLSRHQHGHVRRLIEERGLAGKVSVELRDYRALPEDEPWDKIASVGMFEHVGVANLPAYFGKLFRLLRPGGLLMNHGITAGGTRNAQLGAGLGDFIERNIFPGGELLHVSHVVEVLSEQGLEPVDAESLRPHYARTLWSWSDALESRLDEARRHCSEAVLRAYRLYLAGSAMCFEQGWISLFQILAARPDGRIEPHLDAPTLPGAQSAYPFNRSYMYRP